MYYYLYDNEVYVSCSVPIVSDKHVEITEAEYDAEQEKKTIIALNERRAELLEEQKTETDTLNLLLIQRELEDINAYFEGKE